MNTENAKEKSKPGKLRRGINRLLLWLNYFLLLGLGVAYLAPYISPERFWPIAFFGLFYPLLAILNLIFSVYWLAQWRKRFLLPLIAVLIGWNYIVGFAQLNGKVQKSKTKNSEKISVMSYNVKVFDLYNWSHNLETRSKMFDLIRDQDPEILCLQEFYHKDNSNFQNVDSLQRLLRCKNYHVEYTTTLRKTDHWGILTMSKYPILRKGKIVFDPGSNNICIYTDILVRKDTVRIYNVHLQSIRFDYGDLKFIEDFKNNREKDDFKNIKNLAKRLKNAYRLRAPQADMIARHISHCRYPIIVCGDYNDTPSSYTYRKIRGELTDAFIESGNGLGQTYAGTLPSFRIDYIMHSPSLQSHGFETIKEQLSDHYPIHCYIELFPKN